MADERGKHTQDRHVPYYAKRTLTAAGETHTEYVKMDPDKGLGVKGRSGYIINDGPGTLDVEVYDGVFWGPAIDLDSGEGFTIEHADDTWVVKVRFTAVGGGATYRINICRGTEEAAA